MAIWQFIADIYPSKGLIKVLGEIPERIPKHLLADFLDENTELDDYEDPTLIFWKDYSKSDLNKVFEFLNHKLPEIEWSRDSNNLFSWGNSETNDITICIDDNNVIESFGFRLDLREFDSGFVAIIFDICSQLDCLISNKQGELINSNQLELRNLIAKSNSSKFVSDPKEFLKGISNGKIKIE